MEDVAAPTPSQPTKKTTLSVDRAAFLLLRVKKAFKKKRQQRKEKQSQQGGAFASGQSSTHSDSRKIPPPLLRSRTLPAIIMPGLPSVSMFTTQDKQTARLDERILSGKQGGCSKNAGFNRWSLLTRTSNANNNNNSCSHINHNTLSVKSLHLPNDDSTFTYRRKSSGSTPYSVLNQQQQIQQHQQHLQHHHHQQQQQQQQQQYYTGDGSYFQLSDNFECHADGSLLLRIPAPHVVAARAYHFAPKRRVGSTTETTADTFPLPISIRDADECEDIGSGSGAGTSSSSSSSTALTRLAKLLHQTSKSTTVTPPTQQQQQHGGDCANTPPMGSTLGLREEAPRRLSWERRKDSSALQRSASIDSFAEIVFSDMPRPGLDLPRGAAPPFSKRPSTSSLYSNYHYYGGAGGDIVLNISAGGSGGASSAANSRRESLLSPSSTRRNKLNRNKNDNLLTKNRVSSRSEFDARRYGKCFDDFAARLSEHIPQYNYNINNNNNSNNNNYNNNTLNEHQDICNDNKSQKSSNTDDDICITNSDFCWTEQITQNVSVAKMRTALSASCNAKDIKEMEYLLPNAVARNANAAHEQRLSQQLSISRQSRDMRNLDIAAGTSAGIGIDIGLGIGNGNGKGNAMDKRMSTDTGTDENRSTNGQNLAIYRHPSSLRDRIGNTPHPNRNKMTKKQLKLAQAQLEKLSQSNLHLHALFSAVEHGHLEKARTIIESIDVDVNCTNTDGLSALDVAVLSNNRSMTRMLLQHGAIDSSQFSAESIGAKLNGLLKDAESRINDLSAAEAPCQSVFLSRPSISSIIIGNTGSSVTGCTGSEVEKQIGVWERRVKSLRRLLLGWDQARPPDCPASVTVDVTNENSITVQILEPFEGAIGTKFKVQWSTRADFGNIVGERELSEWTNFHGTMGAQCHISGLTQGRRYFIRCACGNIKEWSAYKTSVPASVVPSSWRDLNNRLDRYFGRQRVLDELFTAVRLTRPAEASDITLDPAGSKRIHKKKTTIKQLFSVASKFQKTLRRGIYLASIVYYDDKVLVTSEDFPPVIEIDESYPSSLHMDYYWLMKVACTWDDVKLLRSDMERHLSSAVHFRTKILTAICQMQSALFTDLGLLYYKPLRDSKGTVVITCIQSVKSPKSVSILNSRWLPVQKLQKKVGALHEDSSINELLISSIDDQILYHQTALQTLEPGLYLGYLKMQCSMDQIQVVVPVKSPNVLPHQRVRENSHISAEEWQILHRDGKYGESASSALRLPLEFNNDPESTSEVQRLFLYDLTNAAHKLFASMNIKQAEAITHRFYDVEVIEISKEISFLLICPSVELSCAVPGQTELLLQRDDLVSLSIQAFEMIHLRTYQPIILQKYARLSCILELDTTLANHSHREAFSTTELQCAKERLAKLQELTNSLNSMWKGMRWLMDVIAFARDKNASQSSNVMRDILDFANAQDDGNSGSNKQHLLQLPIRETKLNKVGSGRGSWPGPGADTRMSNNSSGPEHSKSEQNLDMAAITPASTYANKALFPPTSQANDDLQQLLPTPDVSQRKNSGDSQQTTHSFYSVMSSNMDLGGSSSNSIFAIPPSRSDDTLALAAPDLLRHTQGVLTHRKRTSTTCSISQAKSMSTPLITVQSASSAPYLAGSSLSLKGCYATEFEHKPIKSETQLNKEQLSAQRHTMQHIPMPTTATGHQQQQHEMKNDKPIAVPITPTASHAPTSSSTAAAAAAASSASASIAFTRPSRDEDAESCTSLGSEQSSGIIQVYTAYNTGLASGTSLKLHVTHKTTAREVINLVVKQLNMAAVLKGSNGPIYTAEMLENFCLVAVIGARERCLRDDFKPLQLQSPWRKGRLYVRQKHELLAAIEHSNRKSHLI